MFTDFYNIIFASFQFCSFPYLLEIQFYSQWFSWNYCIIILLINLYYHKCMHICIMHFCIFIFGEIFGLGSFFLHIQHWLDTSLFLVDTKKRRMQAGPGPKMNERDHQQDNRHNDSILTTTPTIKKYITCFIARYNALSMVMLIKMIQIRSVYKEEETKWSSDYHHIVHYEHDDTMVTIIAAGGRGP